MGFFSGITGKASRTAANIQNAKLQQALDLQQGNRSALEGLFGGAVQRGDASSGALNALLGLAGPQAQQSAFGQFKEAPGTEFVRQQGLQGIDRSAASRGQLFSGKTLADASQFNAGLAQQGFGNYINQLLALSQQGGADRGNFANALTGNTNAQSNLLGQQGNALAQGRIGQANAQTGLLNFGGGLAGRAAGFFS